MQPATRKPYGRIRVRYDQAQLFHRLLWQERGVVSRQRAEAKEKGLSPDVITGFNQYIALIDATKEEILRLAEEQGWELRELRLD